MKSKTQHTPEPWVHNGEYIEASFTIGSVIVKETIARVDYIGNIGIRHANARLIAAAPELLAIVKLMDQFNRGILSAEKTSKLCINIRLIIAKAEGK